MAKLGQVYGYAEVVDYSDSQYLANMSSTHSNDELTALRKQVSNLAAKIDRMTATSHLNDGQCGATYDATSQFAINALDVMIYSPDATVWMCRNVKILRVMHVRKMDIRFIFQFQSQMV